VTTVDEPVTPPFRRRTGAEELAALLDSERAQVAAGQAEPCGKVCDPGCHPEHVCLRAAHPHDREADMGIGGNGMPLPKGNVENHLGYVGGQLTQWTCHPSDHDGLTDEQRAAKREADEQAARTAETEDLLNRIDLGAFAAALAKPLFQALQAEQQRHQDRNGTG
jgi:hypothetical protein